MDRSFLRPVEGTPASSSPTTAGDRYDPDLRFLRILGRLDSEVGTGGRRADGGEAELAAIVDASSAAADPACEIVQEFTYGRGPEPGDVVCGQPVRDHRCRAAGRHIVPSRISHRSTNTIKADLICVVRPFKLSATRPL
jgi:hypothetical protein